MKEIGYIHIKFKKNNGEWHHFMQTKLSYDEAYETEYISFTYEEFINEDFEFRREFSRTKDSIFPWERNAYVGVDI